jgi:hypothetical protein
MFAGDTVRSERPETRLFLANLRVIGHPEFPFPSPGEESDAME